MSVIVKGMEMPKSCEWCFARVRCYWCEGYKYYCVLATDDAEGWRRDEVPQARPKWCPLEEADPIHRNPEDAYREDFGKESDNE